MGYNMNKVKRIATIAIICIIASAIGVSIYNYTQNQKIKKQQEDCQNLAHEFFIDTFGTADDIYDYCKTTKEQELYKKNKKLYGLDGATLEDHQKIFALCECATANLYKTIIQPWLDKCYANDATWLLEPAKMKTTIQKDHKIKNLFIDTSYELCERFN